MECLNDIEIMSTRVGSGGISPFRSCIRWSRPSLDFSREFQSSLRRPTNLMSNSLISEPLLALNMIDSYSEFGYLVLCFSNGYFVYDLILSVLNLSYPGRLEIIVHHILTISCLTVSTVSKRFMGYCMTALTVEISNIFLHLRQLFAISGIDAKSKIYRINSIITISELRSNHCLCRHH